MVSVMFDRIDLSKLRSELNLAEYRLWWFTPYLRLGAKYFPRRLHLMLPWMTGAVIFLPCLFIALASGFVKLYLTSVPVYLGVFGISYLTFVVCSLLRKYLQVAFHLKPLLSVDDTDFDALFAWWLGRMCNNRQNLIYSLVLVVIGIVLVDYAWVQPDLFQRDNMLYEFVRFMPKDWYMPPLVAKIAIIDIFGFFVLSGIAVSVRGLILFLVGVSRAIGRLKIRTPYLTRLAYQRFRELDAVHLQGAIHYLVGPFLISLGALPGGFTLVSMSLVIILGLLGACIYLVPHFLTLRELGKSRAALYELIAQAYVQEVSKVQGTVEASKSEMNRLSTISVLDSLLEDIGAMKTWPLELSTWLKGLAIFLAPIAFEFLLKFAG